MSLAHKLLKSEDQEPDSNTSSSSDVASIPDQIKNVEPVRVFGLKLDSGKDLVTDMLDIRMLQRHIVKALQNVVSLRNSPFRVWRISQWMS